MLLAAVGSDLGSVPWRSSPWEIYSLAMHGLGGRVARRLPGHGTLRRWGNGAVCHEFCFGLVLGARRVWSTMEGYRMKCAA